MKTNNSSSLELEKLDGWLWGTFPSKSNDINGIKVPEAFGIGRMFGNTPVGILNTTLCMPNKSSTKMRNINNLLKQILKIKMEYELISKNNFNELGQTQ